MLVATLAMLTKMVTIGGTHMHTASMSFPHTSYNLFTYIGNTNKFDKFEYLFNVFFYSKLTRAEFHLS